MGRNKVGRHLKELTVVGRRMRAPKMEIKFTGRAAKWELVVLIEQVKRESDSLCREYN